MLSIGKLGQLAWMHNHDVPTEKSALDGDLAPSSPGRTFLTGTTAFDDGLDTVAVQEDLLQQFKAVKPPTRAKQSFEAQVDTILKVKATRLADRPAHSHVCPASLVFPFL